MEYTDLMSMLRTFCEKKEMSFLFKDSVTSQRTSCLSLHISHEKSGGSMEFVWEKENVCTDNDLLKFFENILLECLFFSIENNRMLEHGSGNTPLAFRTSDMTNDPNAAVIYNFLAKIGWTILRDGDFTMCVQGGVAYKFSNSQLLDKI